MQSYYPVPTIQEAMERYKATVTKQNDGRNDITEKFLIILETVLNSRRSFSFSDILYECSVYQLGGATVIRPLFDSVISHLSKLNKVEPTESVYDEGTIYIVHV